MDTQEGLQSLSEQGFPEQGQPQVKEQEANQKGERRAFHFSISFAQSLGLQGRCF